ncbi:helix-turn-helix domain-containing protein [Paenibacillus pabuli]|uniref:helix-turn-helix domain-containing protein n=1 Tax=Paenibacillus pabuli TaxID=1472 RepID=UPI000784A2B8|nr:helix-turn-helix domain-containing protein [Paenibacillus pabuli]MEC0123394.1 helix-turn-helix domain-containing protein [Paenibacillus pabuli]
MNPNKVEFYDAVQRAQNGDRESLLQIISAFQPIIQRMRYQVRPQERDDLSQTIVEGLIIKIMNYKLEHVPTYSEFCKQLFDAE